MSGRMLDPREVNFLEKEAKNKTLWMQVADGKAKKKEVYIVELNKAKIFGLESSVVDTRRAILQAFNMVTPTSGWTSGPMVER